MGSLKTKQITSRCRDYLKSPSALQCSQAAHSLLAPNPNSDQSLINTASLVSSSRLSFSTTQPLKRREFQRRNSTTSRLARISSDSTSHSEEMTVPSRLLHATELSTPPTSCLSRE